MKFRHLLVISLSILAGVCFGVAVATHLLTTGSLNKTYRAYIVQSGSMEPALPVGAIVFTQSSPIYSVGDIVTFSPNGGETLVTHRISSIEGSGFRTKGDANEDPDNLIVTRDQIVGKSILSVPKLGYFADFVRTPKGFVFLIVIPASIIIYEELKAVLNEIKSMFTKKKNDQYTKKAVVFLPIFGVMFMLVSGTGSFFTDREISENNNIQIEEPSPAASPVPDADIGI